MLAEYYYGYHRSLYLWDLAKKSKLPAEVFRVPEDGLGVCATSNVLCFRPVDEWLSCRNIGSPRCPCNARAAELSACKEAASTAARFWIFVEAASCIPVSRLTQDFPGGLRSKFGPKQPAGSRLLVWDLSDVSAAAEKDSQDNIPADLEGFMSQLLASPNPDKEKTIWEYPSQTKAHAAMMVLALRPKEAVAGIKKYLGPASGKADFADCTMDQGP